MTSVIVMLEARNRQLFLTLPTDNLDGIAKWMNRGGAMVRVTLTIKTPGDHDLSLTLGELRPETVAAVLADARSLCERLEAAADRCRAIVGEAVHSGAVR